MRLNPQIKRVGAMSRRWARAWLMAAAVLLPGLAAAQVIVVSSAATFEGNAGSKVLKLPVNFIGAQPGTVIGTVSAVPLSGAAFTPATSGAACGGNVDFVGFTNVQFTIPPNTPNGTLSINILICGDAVVEPNEHIFVSIVVTSGAQCTGDSCGAIGTILDDDGPPRISINNVSTSEPISGTKTASFTVSLNHTSLQPVSVNFSTRNGTAKAPCVNCSPAVVFPDYNIASGTLTIPAGALTGSINVGIRADPVVEPNESFFVDLSAPVNATVGDGIGQGTIIDNTLTIGGFDLSPADARAQVGETLNYTLDWTVPPNLVWRNLKSLDLRLRRSGDDDGRRTALWLRWDEASNRFSLCSQAGRDDDDDEHGVALHHALAAPVVCGAGELPGSASFLVTPYVMVDMSQAAVIGSGPTGQRVTLKLGLKMLGKSADHKYRVELAAADDFGNVDAFVGASTLRVDERAEERGKR